MEASFPKDIIMIKLKLKLLINKLCVCWGWMWNQGHFRQRKTAKAWKKTKPKNNEETQNKREKKNPLRLGWRVR